MSEKILEINDLVVKYKTDEAVIHAVNGVSISIEKGETLGLVGETGAGKTTIARAIMRILQSPPAEICGGNIIFDGQDVLKLSEKEMRKIRGNRIAMIFQDPMTALNPIETIGSQIAEAVKQHNKLSKAEAEFRAAKMLEMVGIPAERFHEYPHQFSGGMKQRVVIAIALACNPEILLADEPTTALDVTIQAQVIEMMQNLKDQLGTSVVLITHDLGVVAGFCQKVAVVYAGEIVEYGTARQIFKNPSHPYTVGLFGSLPRLNSKNRRLSPIKGLMPDPSNLPAGCSFADRCPKATEQCRQAKPAPIEVEGGHISRCFYAEEGR